MNDAAGTKKLFWLGLAAERLRAQNATGDTPKDFKYAPADSVRRSSLPDYVHVTFQGKEHGPVRETSGALDGDENKSTALILTDDGKYWKLWYLNSDVQ